MRRSPGFSAVGAPLLALLGIGGVVIKANVTVADGSPGDQSILVDVTTSILMFGQTVPPDGFEGKTPSVHGSSANSRLVPTTT